MLEDKNIHSAVMLGLLCGTVFLALTCVLILSPLLVAIAGEFETTVPVAGQLMSVTSFTWAFTAIAAGALSDTYGKKPILVLGLSLTILSVFGSAFAPDYRTLLLLRLTTGLGAATLPTIGFGAVADLFPPQKRGKAFGIVVSSVSLGMAIGVPTVAFISAMGGWRLPFIYLGSALSILLVLIFLFFPDIRTKETRSQSFLDHFKKVGKIKIFWVVLLANSLQVTSLVAIISYLPAFLMRHHSFSIGDTALPLMIVGFGGVFGSLIGGSLSTKAHRFKALSFSFICSAALSAATYSIAGEVWVTMLLSFTISLLLTTCPPTILTIATDLAGESKTTATGLFSFSNQMGTFGGASLGGLSLFLGGFSYIGYLGTLATLTSIFALWIATSRTSFQELPD
ncbi:MAG: MFS transporter [Proteobacteria bacterium]|nr:MFS transporter [Pseudomonadota bacterium]